MHISLNWIKQYTDINLDKEALVSKVRSQIGEVETVTDYSEKYKGILVAQIESKEDHPEADKLAVFQVNIGGKQSVQVVAGDKTLEVGTTVAYFPPETKVPYNTKPDQFDGVVRAVKLRGVESNGMLASAKELDLGSDHSVVLRLNLDAKPGTTLIEAMEFEDVVMDIENKALANRADCFGVLGISREIAGIQGIKFQSPDWYIEADKSAVEGVKTTLPLKIDNQGGDLCPRYTAITMSNVTVKPSPIWLQSLLLKSGVRPISNVVDITNYLMILTGQPLHAFDYDKVAQRDPNSDSSAYVTIRTAKPNESVTTLDGKTHEVDSHALLICDSTNPVAIGGIMGGLETEIDENTKNIIIECATFDKYNIRKSSMKLGIFTEAVTRFTKGQDPEKCEPVLFKAVELVSELAGGEVASEFLDSYPSPASKVDIEVSVEKLNSHLGTQLSQEQISTLLDNVELYNRPLKDGWISVDVPSFRGDLRIKEDIHEEVGRLYGYNNIEQTLPIRDTTPTSSNPKVALQKLLRATMTASGANEIVTYNFQSSEMMKRYQQSYENAYHLKNSLSPELEYMRTSILPSVYEKLLPNIQDGHKEVALFEINKAHSKLENDSEGLPLERTNLAFALSVDEKKAGEAYSGSPYYSVKKYLEEVLTKVNLRNVEYTLVAQLKIADLPVWIQNSVNMYDQNSSAVITYTIEKSKHYLGVIGGASPMVVSQCKLPKFTGGFEISIDELLLLATDHSNYSEPSRYPKISNDLCFILDQDVPYTTVKGTIMGSLNDSQLIVTVSPVDIYQTEKQKEEGLKQLTFRISLQSKERTLTNDEVNTHIQSVVKAVEKEFKAKLLS